MATAPLQEMVDEVRAMHCVLDCMYALLVRGSQGVCSVHVMLELLAREALDTGILQCSNRCESSASVRIAAVHAEMDAG